MNNKTEAQTFAETFEMVRSLSKFYLSKFGEINVYERLTINEKSFNSPYWIAAHLTWSEHFILIEGLGGEKMNIPWLEKFSFGTEPSEDKDFPKFDDVLKKLDEVHDNAMKIVKALTDEQLDEPNPLGITFGGEKNKRAIIKHAIRHEPMHIGQLSWYLKLNNVKMP